MSSNLPVVREDLETEEENIIFRDFTFGMVFGLMVGTFIGHFLIPQAQQTKQEDKVNDEEPLKLAENTSKHPNPIVVQDTPKVPVTQTTGKSSADDNGESQVTPDVSSEDNRVTEVTSILSTEKSNTDNNGESQVTPDVSSEDNRVTEVTSVLSTEKSNTNSKGESQVLPDVSAQDNRVVDVSKYNK